MTSKPKPPRMMATTKGALTRSVGTIPSPRVRATASPKNTPTKFPVVARATAARGLSTRDPTTVEMALAASVKPLQKVQRIRRPKAAANHRSNAVEPPWLSGT